VIRYRLRCAHAHEFEAWFASSDAFAAQAATHKISCPECGDEDVAKAIMAPSLAVRGRAEHKAPASARQEAVEILRETHRTLLAAMEDVGGRFPEEARKIHYGEAEARGIRGTASGDEVAALRDEGIEIVALPSLPEDAN
jgi:hypothetical protein